MDEAPRDKCPACSTQFFGPVKYCPFCGKRVEEEVSPPRKRGPIIENLSASNPKENAVTITALAISEEGADITQAEWWIGGDPGPGKGNPIEVTFNSPRVHITASINISQFKEGEYLINVRSKDVRDVWGSPQVISYTKNAEVSLTKTGPTIKDLTTKYTNESAVVITASAGIEDDVREKKKTDLTTTPPRTMLKVAIAGAVVLLVVIFSYLIFHKDKPDGPKKDQAGGPREIARVVALETLRQGTDLSVTISKLPKLESVLQAAKKLQDISPRYQDQVASAESTISSAQKTRDKYLMAYIGKALELGRYTPEQISYALGVVRNGDLTPREKIVSDLLTEHVNAVRSGTKPNPSKILSNFKNRFTNFVD